MRNIKYTLYIALLAIGLSSCNDFLEQAPDERLEINTLDKAEKTLIGSYQNTRGIRFTHFSSDDASLATQVYSEDVAIEDLYTWGNPNGANEQRDFRNQKHQDSPSGFWLAAYGAISQVNHALRALDQIKIPEDEMAKAAVVRGEALVVRSYNHFMLVNLFAKHYDYATASTDLGVPYVVEPETTLVVNYKRETVEEVYNKAQKDLEEGIQLLESNFQYVNTNKYRFTLSTVYNYASRFYTFRNKDTEDISKAKIYGLKAINEYGGAEQMMAWSTYQGNELLPVDIDNQAVGMVQLSYSWIQYDRNYHMTQGIKAQYYDRNPFAYTDDRMRIYYEKQGTVFTPAYYYTLDRQSSGVSGYDLFPIYEAILNTAEAHIRLNELDEAKALMEKIGEKVYQEYNESDLTTNKLKQFYGKSDAQEAWTDYLLYERRMMFLLQGLRWFDLKRYNLDVNHLTKDGTIIKLNDIAPNRDYQIPLFAITEGLTPNP
ncbi:MAG: RagB/SusD family nutrient uptake outer membrane protein [Bacteroidales bacterium]|nr:RagB/SusD family nutrient uptake outer membrane protein [Bacteroidales bacterium]